MRISWPQGLLLAGVTLTHAFALQGLTLRHAPSAQGDPHQRIPSRVVHAVTRVAAQPPVPAQVVDLPPPLAQARRVADETTHPPASPPAAGYLPARELDWPALPRSAPDTTVLDGQSLSGLPLSLRLFIDAHGRVTAVEPLTLADDDRAAWPALRAMFLATAYSPGRRHGHDVASTLDLALGVEHATADDTAPLRPPAGQHAAAR